MKWKRKLSESQDTQSLFRIQIMKNELAQKIEAVLFYRAEPVEEKELAKILGEKIDDVRTVLDHVAESLADRGIRLVRADDTVLLATAPEFSALIEKIITEERESTLGRASIETLSIVAYKGPVSKKEIEYIRGVNCDYAIRTLLLRGLVEKSQSKTDERVSVYTVTPDTVLHLGLSKISDLPEYAEARAQLETHTEAQENTSTEDTETEHGE